MGKLALPLFPRVKWTWSLRLFAVGTAMVILGTFVTGSLAIALSQGVQQRADDVTQADLEFQNAFAQFRDFQSLESRALEMRSAIALLEALGRTEMPQYKRLVSDVINLKRAGLGLLGEAGGKSVGETARQRWEKMDFDALEAEKVRLALGMGDEMARLLTIKASASRRRDAEQKRLTQVTLAAGALQVLGLALLGIAEVMSRGGLSPEKHDSGGPSAPAPAG